MHLEIIADILTVVIFAFLVYIWKNKFARNLLVPLLLFVSGVFLVSVSDAVSLLTSDPVVECLAGKFTAAGALISISSLFHALTVFPTRSKMRSVVPTVYIISGALIFYIFFTSHLLYCDPILGGTRGILWDSFIVWSYSLLFADTILPGIRYFTLRIKVQKIQELLIFVGTGIAFIFVGIGEIFPYFIGGTYKTSIFALPVMGAFYVYSSTKYGMFIKIPGPEESHESRMNVKIGDGKIVAIANTHGAYSIFRNIVSEEPGMVVSIKPPDYIRKNYDLQKTPILWISYFAGKYKPSILPGRLHFEGMESIIDFVRKGGKIILFEGAEYIIYNFGRGFLAEFVESVQSLNSDVRMIFAVDDLQIVEGFADETHVIKRSAEYPMVILTNSKPDCKTTLKITTRDMPCESDSGVIMLTNDLSVDKLIFEGMKYIEDSEFKDVYIHCMDHIISMAGEKNAVNFLKDVVDFTLMRGGKVYIRYTPLMTESPLFSLFVDDVR